jgi:serine/threonine-protein kinase
MDRFVRCPHCRMPHDAAERVCPTTGLRIDPQQVAQQGSVPPARHSRPGPPPPAPSKPRLQDKEGQEQQEQLIGLTIGGRYLIKGILGEGGMGTVYDAEHLGLSRQVAIKVLSPSQAKKRVAVKRFQQEARAAGAIGHPNICEVYDLGQLDDASPYLVMERLAGQTLAERIQKEGGLPFPDVIEIMTQVLSGLQAAHEKGIIHRDIKPENIFLARRIGAPPIIKLLDFGVSKMMPEFQTGEDQLDLTRTGMVMGTPYYMSPEQARGERNLDGRVDVYACGVVMYEAIAGKRPFLAPNYNALLLAIINTTPRSLREVRPNTPPELELIITHAMAKNRVDRYASAKHFLRDIAPPAPDQSSPRLPPPPNAEERMRAQQLGGVLRQRRDTGPTDSRRRVPEPAPSRPVPPPPGSRPKVESDSIEIPIDVVVDDNDATAIYDPR